MKSEIVKISLRISVNECNFLLCVISTEVTLSKDWVYTVESGYYIKCAICWVNCFEGMRTSLVNFSIIVRIRNVTDFLSRYDTTRRASRTMEEKWIGE